MLTSAFKKLFSSGKKKKKKSRHPEINAAKTPEELCGITAEMSPSELKNRLAELYQRHNRASSSLDENLRAEAEIMLDAIVACRERYLD